MIYYLYLADFLGKLLFLSISVLAIFGVVLLGAFIAVAEGKYELKRVGLALKEYTFIPAIALFFIAVIPSQTTMYLMLSSKFIQDVSSGEQVSSLAKKSMKLLEEKLDEMLEKKK